MPETRVCLHPALVVPNLQYDVRYPPSENNPQLSPAILATPASNPLLLSLDFRVGDLPWTFNVFPSAEMSPGKAYITVHDVLLAIYYHLRAAAKGAEYEAMAKSRRGEIYREFERRVGADPIQRAKGLRRVDFLEGQFCARGLVSAHPKGNIWDVVICQLTSGSEAPASGLMDSRPAKAGDDPAKLFSGLTIQKPQAEHSGTDSPKDDTVSEASEALKTKTTKRRTVTKPSQMPGQPKGPY
jgi:hypothetical protein